MKNLTQVPLGDFMVRRAGSVDPAKFPDEEFDLYSIPAFDARHPEIVHGSEIGSSKQLVRTGDVLLSRIVPHIRRAWVVGPDRGRRLIASGEWMVFRSDGIHPEWLRHLLVSDGFHRRFMQTVAGVGGSLLRARPAHVAQIDIDVPPLDEQRRIASLLDHAEALRAKRREAIARLDELTQSIFIDMFGDPLTNSRGWDVRPLAELVDANRPITYGILKPGPDQGESGVKYVRVRDMKEGGIRLTEVQSTTSAIASEYKRSRLVEGDLLMSIRGHVGRFAVVPAELNGANITQDTARIALVGASTAYVRQCLSTAQFQHWMARHTKGVAVRGINLGDVRKMPIPLPPKNMQAKFQELAGDIERTRSEFQRSANKLDRLFSSLQSRAFQGEL